MNRPFTMAAEGLERHRFSVSDIERMVESGVLDAESRWELLGRIAPAMFPELDFVIAEL